MSLRKITSLTALLAFVALAFTSVMTYLAPRGPGSSGWEALGLGKHEWFAIHTNLGALFIVASALHIILNIKPILAYLKNKDGKFRILTINFNIALLLTAWFILSSLYEWPPISALQSFKENRGGGGHHHAEEVVEQTLPEKMPERMPMFHGWRSLEKVCAEYGMDVVLVVRELRDLGVDAQADWSLKEIAKKNEMETAAVYDVVRQLN